MKLVAIPCYLLGFGLFRVAASLTFWHWRSWLHPLMYDGRGNYHATGFMSFVSELASRFGSEASTLSRRSSVPCFAHQARM